MSVDHGLQDGSAGRAAAVADDDARPRARPGRGRPVEVGPGAGPEAAARAARYAALDDAADRHGAAAVLLGHTRDDQAETVLLGLARGSGARSLAGMAPVAGRYRRPLLGLGPRPGARGLPRGRPRAVDGSAQRRAGLRAAPGAARGAARARSGARPRCRGGAGPHRPPPARRRRRAGRVGRPRGRRRARDPGGEASTARGWRALPAAVRARVLRAAALAAGCPAGGLGAAHVEAVDALVVAWRGQAGVDLPGRVVATRRCGRLTFGRRPSGTEAL